MRSQRGFTLIEIMFALIILVVVILGLATASAQVLHVVTLADRRTAAIQLADSRIDAVQMEPNYATLDSIYVGTETFSALPGYTRQTAVVHVGGPGQSVDYKTVTVTVTGPGLVQPVARTIMVAAP